MKRILLGLIGLCSLPAFSQKVVDHPRFAFSTAENVTITRIEIRNTGTILDFSVTGQPGSSMTIPHESYIQSGRGGDKLEVVSAEGAELDSAKVYPEKGVVNYRLVFPPIDPSTDLLDFGEGSQDGSWLIYNLELVPVKPVSVFPESLVGNWFRTDGSKEWVYGFREKALICNGTVYTQIGIQKQGKTYQINAIQGNRQLVLYVKTSGKNALIGTQPDKMELFSHTRLTKPNYVWKDDQALKLPIYKSDTAIYKGYIEGYLPRFGKTGMAYVNDVFSGDQYSYLIEIADNGTFEAKIPVYYSGSVIVKLLGFHKGVFMEPGKITFQYLNFSGPRDPSEANASLFMGACAQLNEDLILTEPWTTIDFFEALTAINKMTQVEFRDWMLGVRDRKLDSLNQFVTANPICGKALQIRKMGISYRACYFILAYNMYRESVKKSRQRPTNDASVSPDKSFYSFMPSDDLNSPISLAACGEYYGLINQMLFADVIRPKTLNLIPAFKDTIDQKGMKLSENEKIMLDRLASGKGSKGADVSQAMKDEWSLFMEKNQDLLTSISLALQSSIYTKNLKDYFGIDPGLVTDIASAQWLMSTIKRQMGPVSDQLMNTTKGLIKDPFIFDYLLTRNREMAKKMEIRDMENAKKTGYFVNAVPKVKADSLFHAILSRYSGKVVFMDFWATWCGPCRAGMEQMKPLKEAYQGKAVEFVYITGPSSPQKTFDLMVPDIKGQHYKLDADGWNYLSSSYKISSIPRYMVFDKTGKLVNDNLGYRSNEELKKLLDTLMEKVD